MRGNGDYPPFPDVSTKHTQTSTWHWNMHWRSIVNKSMGWQASCPLAKTLNGTGQYLSIISATLPTALRHTASEY